MQCYAPQTREYQGLTIKNLRLIEIALPPSPNNQYMCTPSQEISGTYCNNFLLCCMVFNSLLHLFARHAVMLQHRDVETNLP